VQRFPDGWAHWDVLLPYLLLDLVYTLLMDPSLVFDELFLALGKLQEAPHADQRDVAEVLAADALGPRLQADGHELAAILTMGLFHTMDGDLQRFEVTS